MAPSVLSLPACFLQGNSYLLTTLTPRFINVNISSSPSAQEVCQNKSCRGQLGPSPGV